MKIIIAPDSFKESLSALEAAQAIEAGIKRVNPNAQCHCLPMADGGEGTTETILALCGGKWRKVAVQNPLGQTINAPYALLPDNRAVIEMASAAGLMLLDPSERNPLLTHTFGVGQLIQDALDQDVSEIIIGIGGSATNDGGSGMLAALGAKFYDKTDQIITPSPQTLTELARVDLTQLDPRLSHTKLTIACDVNNPLLGENGASAVFGPQKGADTKMVKTLDNILASYAEHLISAGYPDHRQTAGSGAAGGLGFALLGLPQAQMMPGIDLIISLAQLKEQVADADWVITGEGRMDGQTLSGKVPIGVLHSAQVHQVPTIALCGCLGPGIERLNDVGFTAIFPTIPHLDSLDNILKNGAENLSRTAVQVMRLVEQMS